MAKAPKVLILNGPNLNMLASRRSDVYAPETLGRIGTSSRNHATDGAANGREALARRSRRVRNGLAGAVTISHIASAISPAGLSGRGAAVHYLSARNLPAPLLRAVGDECRDLRLGLAGRFFGPRCDGPAPQG